MENHRSNSLGGILETAESLEVAALERLENRVVEMVEQLRDSRRKLAASEEEVERLEGVVKDKDKRIETLETEKEEFEAGREEVRKRIESLLDRLETAEE